MNASVVVTSIAEPSPRTCSERQVTAGRMGGVAGHLEVRARGVEVAGCAAGRGHRVRLTLADRVDVQAVEARGELPGAMVFTVIVA